jgi:uncharacterized protein YnzC (UPF0291/DUF896 family)
MEQAKIDRINELARLAKTRALTPEETAERTVLRQEYLAEWRRGTQQVLDNTYIDDGKGHITKLRKKSK